MSTNRKLLIAGGGANQLGVIRAAHRLSVDTVVVDGDPKAPGLREGTIGIAADIREATQLTAIGREHRVDGVFPGAELAVEAVAAAAQSLGVPGITPEVASRVRNKVRMREALAEARGVNPAFRAVTSVDEARDAAGVIGLPVIVKPADANSSKGVRRIDDMDELNEAFIAASARSFTSTALIEEYMDGVEYNVDGLVHEGRFILGGITGKALSPLPHRFDLGIFMPPRPGTCNQDAVERACATALKAIGFENGIVHIEVMDTPTGVKIVEMAGRPGGGRIPSDLIPLTYGMNMLEDAVRIVLGESPQEQRRWERGTALFWIPAETGRVAGVDGVEEARAMPGVVDVVIAVLPGECVDPIIDCVTRDRIGYVLTEGSNVEEAIARAQAARDCCKIRIEAGNLPS